MEDTLSGETMLESEAMHTTTTKRQKQVLPRD